MKFFPIGIFVRLLVAISLLGVLVSPAARAAVPSVSYTWTGAVDSDWSNSGNWNPTGTPNSVPITSDPFFIDNGGTAILSYFDGGSDHGSIIGDANSGFLVIQDFGTLFSNHYTSVYPRLNTIIGNQVGATGGVTVNGGGSIWDLYYNSQSFPNYGLIVGNRGTGSLTLEEGGRVQISDGYAVIGKEAGSTGTLTVRDAGSSFDTYFQNAPGTPAGLTVGESGSAVVNVENGGALSAFGGVVIGREAGSSGVMTVTGAGSQFVFDGLTIGSKGQASLHVSDQGYLSQGGVSPVTIGDSVGSVGELKLDTGAFAWFNDDLLVGNQGQGSLIVESGSGVILQGGATVGNQTGSVGTISVSNGSFSAQGDIVVGNSGSGTVTLTDSGQLHAGYGPGTGLNLAQNVGSVGTLNIGDGGEAGRVYASEINGGSGTATVNFNHTNNPLNFSNPPNFVVKLTGSLAVNQIKGTTVLASTNDYTGQTRISGGTLAVSNGATTPYGTLTSGTIEGTSEVIIESGGTLALVGDTGVTDRINNAATITLDGGTFKLNGLSEGTTTAAGLGNLNLLSTSTLDYDAPATLGILSFSGVGTQIAGSVLNIADWNGAVAIGGGASQLLFAGVGSDFSSKYDQSEVQFVGYDTGYLIVQGISFYEIVPVAIPEPGSAGLLLFGLGVCFFRSRKRKI